MTELQLDDYQEVALAHLRRNPRAALWMDMGLGKTAVVLTAITPDHLPMLVSAPKRVAAEVWPVEVKKWRPDLRVVHVVGNPARRKELLSWPADIYVIGRDNLRDLANARRQPQPWRSYVIDESSGVKTKRSVRWRCSRKISRGLPYVWELTGTPSPNGLLDVWAQVALLDDGERLGATLGEFRAEHFTPGMRLENGVIASWNIRKGHDKIIHRLIEDICLSLQNDGRVKMPELRYNKVVVPFDPKDRKRYQDLKDNLLVDLTDVIGGEVHTAANAGVLSSKLAQITAGFLYVDDADVRGTLYTGLHTNKVQALQEIVDGTGSPVLVFYRFKAEKEMLLKAFPEAETVDRPGFSERWNNGEIPMLLAHPASAGHGLNLQYGGHTIVWTTLNWDLEQWQQANKRLHRRGQKHPVVIHYLETPDTVDGAMKDVLDGKKTVQQALMDHLESPL